MAKGDSSAATIYYVKVRFTEPVLGTAAKDPQVYATYIASLASEETDTSDELASVANSAEAAERKGWTGFHTLSDGTPILYDYMWRGFFKEACRSLRRVKDTRSSKLRAFVKVIDGLVFVFPRQIPLDIGGGEMGVLERPLRASTPQGERVTLARSDTVPAGTRCEFEVHVLGEAVDEATLREWLGYGRYKGIGQWRTGSYGRFEYEISRQEK